MSKDVLEAKELKNPRRAWRGLKRGILVACLLILVFVILAWVFLPRIAERVIRSMIADAGFSQSELRVADVGWRRAVIEDVSLADRMWSIQVKRVEVEYDAMDLLHGTIESLRLIDSSVFVDLSEDKEETTPVVPGQEAVSAGDDPEKYWYKTITDALNQLGVVRAEDVAFLIYRDGSDWKSQMDITIDHGGDGHPTVSVLTEDFELTAYLKTFDDWAEWKFDSTVNHPTRFLDLVELAINYDGELLPDGVSLRGAALMHTLHAKGNEVSPLEINARLYDVEYDGGKKPVAMKCVDTSVMALKVDFSGAGEIDLFGKVESVSLPLDPSVDFELKLKPDVLPDWKMKVVWGDEPTRMVAELRQMNLVGAYDDRPVDLDDIMLNFEMINDDLLVEGKFSNEGINVPVNYRQAMKEVLGQWMIDGDLKLGPFTHHRNLPILSAAVDLFDTVEVAGTSLAKMEFSVGSQQPFRGMMAADLSDAEVSVEDGKVKASGVNGVFQLHLLPLPDDDPSQRDPSYYTFDFTAKKLNIASKDALDFDLAHQVDQSVKITGKGNLALDSAISGELNHLTLHGEKDGNVIDLVNTGFKFELKEGRLISSGETSLGANKIPFFYQHELKDVAEGWELDGVFEIREADLNEPIDQAVMFVDAMAGNTLSGKMSMKMDFSLGSEKDFDGELSASVTGGTLTMADDGPVIEGLDGDIRLSSMKNKQTKGFHRVTATRIKAFDMEMKNLRLDYKLLPKGDIVLKNTMVNTLGGQVWLDPFTLPEGDGNYQFKVRAKRLDVAELAKLFPEFNGEISGRVDGLLPMESVGGEIRPRAGGMYLTPRTKGKLRYDAGDKFSAGLDPKTKEYKRMKMVETSLRNLDLELLSIRLFDPRDKDKAIVLKLRGQAHHVPGSPPIHLNINGFKPDDDTVDFFDLLLKHRDRLDFGL